MSPRAVVNAVLQTIEVFFMLSVCLNLHSVAATPHEIRQNGDLPLVFTAVISFSALTSTVIVVINCIKRDRREMYEKPPPAELHEVHSYTDLRAGGETDHRSQGRGTSSYIYEIPIDEDETCRVQQDFYLHPLYSPSAIPSNRDSDRHYYLHATNESDSRASSATMDTYYEIPNDSPEMHHKETRYLGTKGSQHRGEKDNQHPSKMVKGIRVSNMVRKFDQKAVSSDTPQPARHTKHLASSDKRSQISTAQQVRDKVPSSYVDMSLQIQDDKR